MAFNHRFFSVIAYANGFTLWQYSSTEDTLETIEKDGYFNPMWTIAATDDIIIINPSDGGAVIRTLVLEQDKAIKLRKLRD